MGVKIKDLDENNLKSKMIQLIGQTYLNCGFKLDETQLIQTIDEFCDDLKKYHSQLSFEEIELAFKNGYKKIYGDFFGLSNATYFGWVSAYTFAESRLKVKKTILEAKENENKPSKILSKEEIYKIMKVSIVKSFEDFKRGATIFDAGNVKYNYLVDLGLIDFTKERKNDIMKMAEHRLRQEAIEMKQKNETIEKALSKIMPQTIISESKKQALIEYYKELVEMEIEIEDEIKNKHLDNQ